MITCIEISPSVGTYHDVCLVSAKHLVIQGIEYSLACQKDLKVCFWSLNASVVLQGVGAAFPLVPETFWLLTSFFRVKAHRKQTARGQKVTNDEDHVMGTVTWVSVMSIFSCSIGGGSGHVHSMSVG